MEAALDSFLSPEDSERLEGALGRRLDGLIRQVERLERNVTISNDALALFVQFWLTATPSLLDTAQPATKAKGRAVADEIYRDLAPADEAADKESHPA